MTTAERERLAYAEGFVETAKLFARLDDMHHALGTEVADNESLVDDLKEKIDELKEERDSLFEDYQTMRAQRDELRQALYVLKDLLANDTDASKILAYIREMSW
jgi:uncharacterized coiled-coil DUF342 family protein